MIKPTAIINIRSEAGQQIFWDLMIMGIKRRIFELLIVRYQLFIDIQLKMNKNE